MLGAVVLVVWLSRPGRGAGGGRAVVSTPAAQPVQAGVESAGRPRTGPAAGGLGSVDKANVSPGSWSLAAQRRVCLSDAAVRRQAAARLERAQQAAKTEAWARARQEGWVPRETHQRVSVELMAIRGNKVYAYVTHNANAAISTAADQIRRTAPYDVSGTNHLVGVWDAGDVRATHREFGGRVVIEDYSGNHYHATHVAGTIGAAGVEPSAMGMAPAVGVVSYDWNGDLSEMTSRGMAAPGETDKIPISNHSYGYLSGWYRSVYPPRWYGTWGNRESDNFGIYDSLTADWDALCYDAPYFLPFKSAGNDRSDTAPSPGQTFQYYDGGWKSKAYDPATDPYADNWDNGGYDTISIIGNAKNIVTVGAVNDAVSGGARSLGNATMTSYSCWGPTDDGRVKPDLVANGSLLYSTSSGTDSAYEFLSGTSMACPNAAGSAALLVDYYARLFAGGAMRASTLKALLLHAADDLGNPGPDYVFGFGLMNVKAAADLLREHAGFPGAGRLREDALSATNLANTFAFTADAAEPIRVTLCWTDPPGQPLSGMDNPAPRLVNDLDLLLIAPDGQTNFPYVLDPANPTNSASTGRNGLDTVEQVCLTTPELTGTYSVVVSMAEAPAMGQQVYSLLVSGSVVPPEIAHTPLENTVATSGVYTAACNVSSIRPLDTNVLWLCWNTDGAPDSFTSNALVCVSNDLYEAQIPAQPLGTTVYYYLHVETTNGLSASEPVLAPGGLHAFSVVSPVMLMISAYPAEHGTVQPVYGLHAVPSGNVVNAYAPLIEQPADTHRYVCTGWNGAGSTPSSGTSNTVSFAIATLSTLEWQWGTQYSFMQDADVAGLLATTTWWFAASTGETVTAPSPAALAGTNFCFVEWQMEGLRQTNTTGVAVNPVAGVVMAASRAATAFYLPENEDADGDGLADWWERRYFGALTQEPGEDFDGDGYLNLEEFQDRCDPVDPGSVPVGPVIAHTPVPDPQASPAPWQIRTTVTDNYSVAGVMLRWRRNGLSWRQTAMSAGGAANEYVGTIPAPGLLGDTFEYLIQATDEWGYLAEDGPHSFFVAYPVIDTAPTNVAVLLLAGESTNLTLSVENQGNTDLTWGVDVVAVGREDDFESGTNGWSHSGQHDLWHLSTNRFISALHAWYCGSHLDHEYENSTDASLVMPLVIPAGGAQLTFWHWPDMELEDADYAWDGGIVELSLDDGTNYAQITPEGGYPYKIVPNVDSPFEPDTPCFAGVGGWQEVTFDLSAFAGRAVRIRFRIGTDAYVTDEGWYIDDVRLHPVTRTNVWLSAQPANGLVAPAGATNVAVLFDSASVPSGTDDVVLLRVLSNDPVTPARTLDAALSVRSIPMLALEFAAQTSTDGTGLVTLSNAVYDADGETVELEILCSPDGGGTWTNAWLASAQAPFGQPAVSNSEPRQVTAVATHDGTGLVTNALETVWATTGGPVPIVLTPNAMLAARVWDGLFWSEAVTSQPFIVDNEPPTVPGGVASSTHATGVWSSNDVVAVAWNAASDGAGAGVAGYGTLFAYEPNPDPPATADTAGLNVLSVPLTEGTDWWFGVRAVDVYGNASAKANVGPFWIDASPPDAASAGVTLPQSESGLYFVGTAITSAWTGFVDGGSGVAGYYYALANGAGTTNGTWTAETTGVSDEPVLNATNTVYVWACDNVGRIGPAASAAVLVLDPDGDFDLDGLVNRDEEIAGTDAGNPASVLELTSDCVIVSNACDFIIGWNTATGRTYGVYYADALTNAPGDWTGVDGYTNLPGTGAALSYTGTVSGTQPRFYRVDVCVP